MADINDSKILYEAFCAIAESYTSIVYMDTLDKRAYPIRLDSYSVRYEERLNEHPPMHDIIEEYVNNTVYRDDREALLRLADCDYVFEELKKESPLLHIYRTIHDDRIVYYRLKIVPVEDGRKLIYGFENIDSQYRIQLEVKSEREMHTMLLDGLSREYMSVWYLDGKSRKVRLLQNNGTDSENGEPVRIGNTMVDYHFSMQKYFGAFVSPDDFDRMMNETSYESLVKNAGENDMYCINYIRINPDRSTSHFQVCYAKTIDASGTANFVFGFRNTDSAI